MPPTFVLGRGKGHLHKWPPLRSLWSSDQRHLRFLRKPVAFAGITFDARADHILPRGRSATVPRDHVIQIEIVPFKKLAAVLARVLVPLENVVAGKFYLLLRQPIEKQKHDHARDPDLPGNRRHQFVIGRGRRDITPAFEIVSQEIVRFIGRNDVGMASVDQRERAPRSADIHRLPEPIENENLTVKQCVQVS